MNWLYRLFQHNEVQPYSWEREFFQLATYKSERLRGIVHTAAWETKMVELQKQYDISFKFHGVGK